MEYQKKKTRKPIHWKECQHCGKGYGTSSQASKFCSGACRLAAFKVRHQVKRVDFPPPHNRPVGSGFVYLIRREDGLYKIGATRDIVSFRLIEIALESKQKTWIEWTLAHDDVFTLERELHTKFNHARVSGEWYRLSSGDVDSIQSLEC